MRKILICILSLLTFTCVYSENILEETRGLSTMTYAQALDYVSGHDYELVSVQDYYYNNFVGDSDYYEGQYARYSNGEISVYFKIDSDSFSIWLDTDEAFIKATTWLQREGYAYDSENSGEGARGQDWIYKKGNSLVSFWSGGGWFEGYNITIK